MAKFKVGDEVAIAALVKITAIQQLTSGKVTYATDRGFCIHEVLMDEIALTPKEPKAEEPAPAPPKFYTGTVFAVSVSDNCPMYNRVNRVFEIVNGSAGERGKAYGIGETLFLSFKHLCERLYGNEWREVKE